jgi:hypothetical protein
MAEFLHMVGGCFLATKPQQRNSGVRNMVEKLEQKENGDDSAERGRPEDNRGGRDKPFEITVVYNGLSKPIEVSKDELIGSVLAKALAAFGNLPAPHILGLYDAEGHDLPDGQTVKDAKVKKGDRLLLRPSTVKAG